VCWAHHALYFTRICHHFFSSDLNLCIGCPFFSNTSTRAGRPRARERESQARVWHDDYGVVRPLKPRAEQHRDAAAAQRSLEELDQQAAARGESDGEEVSELLCMRGCAVFVMHCIGHWILKLTLACRCGGVSDWKIYFVIYSVCNYSVVRREGWNMRIPSIPLRVEYNLRFWQSIASCV
jgi:hypothetical protein